MLDCACDLLRAGRFRISPASPTLSILRPTEEEPPPVMTFDLAVRAARR